MPTFTPYSGTDATRLTDALLAPASGLVIDAGSIQLTAADGAVNFYDGSLAPLGMGAGLLLTSGTTPGTSNTVEYFGADNNLNGDPLLDAVVNTVFQTQSFDATMLSFSFSVTDPAATSISFDLVFGSDEFPEWVDQFVDVAVVMVNGINVALFNHDATHPLSVVSPNLAAGYFIDNGDGHLPIEYDGVSARLKIVAPIHAGTNTITIGIADTGDHIYDSGIFIANLVAGTIPGSGVVATPDTPCTDSSDSVTGSSKDEYLDLKGGNDVAYAGAGDDIVVAGLGDDVVYGGSGADALEGDGGDDFLDGGEGEDTAVYTGARAGYTALYDAASHHVTITDGVTGDGVDTLANVEWVRFSDGLYALDATGLTLATTPPPAPANTPGLVLISGIGAAGHTLTATVSDPDGISGAVSYQWQASADAGASWTDIDGATGNTYTVSSADTGLQLQVQASYLDQGSTPVAELAVSGPKAILETQSGDLVVTLMQLDAPPGTSTITPLTTLLKDAIALGLSPSTAAIAIKTVLGLPQELSLQHDKAWAVLQADPANPTALAVEKVAVQVAILTSLSDDDTGMNLAVAIVNAAQAGQTLDLGQLNDLSLILGIPAELDPVTGKYPQPLAEIYDRNKTMAEALADGGDVSAIEGEWQDLLSLQDGIQSTTIGDLSIPVNQAPQGLATAVLADGPHGASYTVTAADLLAGFTDPDGDALSVQGLSADQGSVSTTDGLSFTISFDAAFSGPVELHYSVVDGLGGNAAASQMFIVADAPVNSAPTGTPATVLPDGSEDVACVLTAADLLNGFTDADGDALTVQGLSADHAGVSLQADGSYLLTPDADYHGPLTLAYEVVDGQGGQLGASLQLQLAAVNDAPVVVTPATASATEDGVVVSLLALAGAQDVDSGDVLGVVNLPATLPAGVSYDPLTSRFALDPKEAAFQALAAGETTTVTVNYGLSDGTATVSTSATFLVAGSNDAPVVTGTVTAAATEGGPVIALDALAQASDVDHGSALFVTGLPSTLPAGVSYSATTHTFNLNPADAAYQSLGAGQELLVRVDYLVSDGSDTAPASVAFMLTGVADSGASILGTAGKDKLTGTAGNDTLNGLGGADTLRGGLGDDTYVVDQRGDEVIELVQQGHDTVRSSVDYTLDANVEDLVLTGNGGITGTGNGLANLLIGNAAANSLWGGGGGDVLEGGAGKDTLSGGAGADTFRFLQTSDSLKGAARDVIKDFRYGQDHIDLGQIDAITSTTADDAFTYIHRAAFSHVAGELRFDATRSLLAGDVNGDGQADFEIALMGVTTLDASAFVL